MKLSTLPAVLLAALVLHGCGSSSGPSGATRFDPPNTDFAGGLGITPPPPVTPDQAKAIAVAAVGGTAVGIEQETENGELLYEVKVETTGGRKEVEVRASDGGVVEIEPDDSD